MEAQANMKKWYKPTNARHAEFKEARKRYRKQRTLDNDRKRGANDATRLSTYYAESMGNKRETEEGY